MKATHLCSAIALFLMASSAVVLSAPYVPKTGNNNNNNSNAKEPPHYDPVVIRFQAAARQRLGGNDIMVINGADALTGKPRQFGVANREPQDNKKYGPMKYDPKPEVADTVNKLKPGEYLKVDIKGDKNSSILWADKVYNYTPVEHEEEPNVYLWDGGYKDIVEKQDVYKIELVKMGKKFVCYAPMVPGTEKGTTNPDPTIVAVAEGLNKTKPKAEKTRETMNAGMEAVEAMLTPAGENYFVQSLDKYQSPRQGSFTKVADADVQGQKGQSVDIDEGGKTVTALLPGKLTGKKWVTDPMLAAEAKKLKAGTAVVFKTREVEGKTYIRALAAAPKEVGKPAAKTADAGKAKSPAEQLLPDKKK